MLGLKESEWPMMVERENTFYVLGSREIGQTILVVRENTFKCWALQPQGRQY